MKHLWRGVALAAALATLGWVMLPSRRSVEKHIRESTASMLRTMQAVQGPPYVPPPPPPWYVIVLQAVGGILFWVVAVAAVLGLFGAYVWALYRTMGDQGPAVAVGILLLSVLVGTQLGRTR